MRTNNITCNPILAPFALFLGAEKECYSSIFAFVPSLQTLVYTDLLARTFRIVFLAKGKRSKLKLSTTVEN